MNIIKLRNSKQANLNDNLNDNLEISRLKYCTHDELRKKPQFSVVPWMEKARPPSSMWFRLTCEPWAVELPDPIDVFSVSRKKVKLTKLGILYYIVIGQFHCR